MRTGGWSSEPLKLNARHSTPEAFRHFAITSLTCHRFDNEIIDTNLMRKA